MDFAPMDPTGTSPMDLLRGHLLDETWRRRRQCSQAFRTQLQESTDAAIGVHPRGRGKMVDPPVQDLPVYGMR